MEGERKARGEWEAGHPTEEGAEAGPEPTERLDKSRESAVSTRRGSVNNALDWEDFLFTLTDSSLLMSSSSSSEMSSKPANYIIITVTGLLHTVISGQNFYPASDSQFCTALLYVLLTGTVEACSLRLESVNFKFDV